MSLLLALAILLGAVVLVVMIAVAVTNRFIELFYDEDCGDD